MKNIVFIFSIITFISFTKLKEVKPEGAIENDNTTGGEGPKEEEHNKEDENQNGNEEGENHEEGDIEDEEENHEEISEPHGLIRREKFAFKELDPENPEFNVKQDLVHDQEGISEMQKYFHIFEDYNYENLEEQLLKDKMEIRFKSVLEFYHLQLRRIIQDNTLNDTNVAPHLIGLLGENFSKFKMDFKEIEISIKAALEKSIEMFFLYKCTDKNFHSVSDFDNCLNFKKDVKIFMMFENFFEIGFYNRMHDLFALYDSDDFFKSQLLEHLNQVENEWKLFFRMRDFIEDLLIEKMKRQIDARFGTGLNVFVQIDK